jgi:NADPH-dependent glutamate synthase beta subunit-like oxidoreductase
MRCRRETIDEPVAQGEIHRYLADAVYKIGREKVVYRKLIAEKAPPSGKKIAIVGAGPAGLTAAFYLVRLGHQVTVYEKKAEAGGVLRWGIPAYRLPKNLLFKEMDLIKALGVQFVFRVQVGTDLDIESLKARNDALLLCLGAGEDRRLGIPGEDLIGVESGGRLLEKFNDGISPISGHRAVVIGGGNSAVDAARSVLRLGAHVTMAYRRSRDEMPANVDELEGAREETVTFLPLVAPLEILADAQGRARAVHFVKMVPGRVDETGRKTPVASEQIVEIEADIVVVAVGECVDARAFLSAGLETDRSGALVVDPLTLRTKDPKIWSAGDSVLGPSTASEAMGSAQKAARDIDAVLTGMDRFSTLFRSFSYSQTVPKDRSRRPMNRARRLAPSERKGNFQEIALGYTGEQAYEEASRCLRCDVKDKRLCSGRRR